MTHYIVVKQIRCIKGRWCYDVGCNVYGDAKYNANKAYQRAEHYNSTSECGCKVEVKEVDK